MAWCKMALRPISGRAKFGFGFLCVGLKQFATALCNVGLRPRLERKRWVWLTSVALVVSTTPILFVR